ncbi:hypothetical protein LSAT2_020191 [Lamellibrachia satsuma]|nr:hypothetical protein LSAT2_020191 [Lamellibrachia satsuma]
MTSLNDEGQTTLTRIAELITLPVGTPCRDDAGTERGHGDVWSTANVCDRNRCHEGVSLNYIIKYGCRRVTAQENPDAVNCRSVSDNSQAFPACCPRLQCDSWIPDSVTTAPCRDKATTFACTFWATHSGCSAPSPFYNFTSNYCELSCGLC